MNTPLPVTSALLGPRYSIPLHTEHTYILLLRTIPSQRIVYVETVRLVSS